LRNDIRVLRAVRVGSVAVGSASLLLSMTVWAEAPGPRDLGWTIGVALLVLSLIANRLLRHAGAAASKRAGPDQNAD